MTSNKRATLPLWRWDPFLVAVVLGLSIVAGVFQRLALSVVSPIVVFTLLVVAIAATVCLLLPLFVPRLRRDAEGSLSITDRTVLAPLSVPSAGGSPAPGGVTGSSADDEYPVVDTTRHQASIDAAFARTGGLHTAVLVPRATGWMRREYRVAVDLLVGTRTYRAGYLPREIDEALDAELAPLAERHEYRTTLARIAQTQRPYAVTVVLGPDPGPADPV
ncbi:hypothetical protein BH09ACT6_BH09ACT6_17650 [soil metagenome]